jgi:hypothetical protein
VLNQQLELGAAVRSLTSAAPRYLLTCVGRDAASGPRSRRSRLPESFSPGGIAMKSCLRSFVALAVALSFVSSQQAVAQGFNIGGIKVQTGQQSNEDRDDDNSNQSNRRSRSRNQSNNNNNSNNGLPDGFQQFIPGNNSNSQGGQNNSNQSRRSGQQGNSQNNQQFKNWQNGQNGFNIGAWNGGKWQGTHDAKKWTQAFGGDGQQPFSSKWYKDHPKAWKYNGNNNNNVNMWVGGSLPGLYTWLGWGNVPQQYQGNWGNHAHNHHEHFHQEHYGQWYPLGVYSLMAGPGDPGTRIVQLAVDQHGHLAGNYYDMISNSNYSLTGNIRQQSQRATFYLNKNQFVRFRANIYELLQPYGSLTVSLPGGEQEWQFVRLEN